MARYRSLFGKDYNLVPDDPDLFLLHCYYYKSIDTLFILFKRYSNGEKVLWKVEEPLVPVFIAKNKPVRNLESMEIRLCDRELVSYKNKSEEVKDMLFESKIQIYKNKYGQKVQRKTFPDVPKRAEALHPSLFLYDVSIEQIVYMEYAMNHYAPQDGLLYEKITIPHIDYAAFDIETTYWREKNLWTINTNTFVDEKSMTAYIDYVKDFDHYNKQQYMTEHPEEFIQAVKEAYLKMVDTCTLKGKTKDIVQKTCRDFINNLTIKVRPFNSEAEMIMTTTKTMFTDHKPDICMAYNNTYDQGKFEERRKALGLPEGMFNERGIGYDDILPPYAADGNIDEHGVFKGEVAIPKKRRVFLNNISHTMVQDLQTAYYSARQGSNYSNYKLDSLSGMILGFGKYNYAHITNDILKLAMTDFWFHSVYALIDSINTLLINKITDEFGSKLVYCFRSKCPIEDTSQSNSTITRSFHTDYYVMKGHVAGCNINKILKSMSIEDVRKASRVIGVDFMPNWEAIHGENKYGGGIVSNPNLYQFDPKDFKASNILNNEAHLTMLRKLRNLVYLDFKSHYPSTIITRNISKSTLYGRITDIVCKEDGKLLWTTQKEWKDSAIYKKHLGELCLSIANKDVISYGAQACNLPTLAKLASMLIPYDSPPQIEPDPIPFITNTPVPTKYRKLTSILSKINQLVFSKTDEEAFNKDNKMFMFTNGSLSYLGSLVTYKYNGINLLDACENCEYDQKQWFYGTVFKQELVSHNEQCNIPKYDPYDMKDAEWQVIPNQFLFDYGSMQYFSKLFTIEYQGRNILLLLGPKTLYYPIDYFLKMNSGKAVKGKNPALSSLLFRCRTLEMTHLIEFRYSLALEDINLEITQQCQFVNLEKAQGSVDSDFLNKLMDMVETEEEEVSEEDSEDGEGLSEEIDEE